MLMHTQFRPSPKYQTHMWAVIMLILLLIMPFILLAFAPGLGWLYAVIFLGANMLWFIPALILVPLYYRSISYELTQREIIIRKGIFTKAEDMVPYHMVTNLHVTRGPIARTLGIGTLEVHTAGFSQQAGAEAKLSGLENWGEVQRQLLELIHRIQDGEGPALPAAAMASGDQAETSTQLLSQILHELQELRKSLRQE